MSSSPSLIYRGFTQTDKLFFIQIYCKIKVC